jgi:hypothetical protein
LLHGDHRAAKSKIYGSGAPHARHGWRTLRHRCRRTLRHRHRHNALGHRALDRRVHFFCRKTANALVYPRHHHNGLNQRKHRLRGSRRVFWTDKPCQLLAPRRDRGLVATHGVHNLLVVFRLIEAFELAGHAAKHLLKLRGINARLLRRSHDLLHRHLLKLRLVWDARHWCPLHRRGAHRRCSHRIALHGHGRSASLKTLNRAPASKHLPLHYTSVHHPKSPALDALPAAERPATPSPRICCAVEAVGAVDPVIDCCDDGAPL